MPASQERFDARFSPEALEDRIISEAFLKAKEHFDSERINPDDFTDIYSPDAIARDKSYVENTEAKIADETTPEDAIARRLGLVFEEIFSDQIEMNLWLGSNVITRKASRFDDIENGVDEVLEVNEEESVNYFALAIDVTHGTSLQKKFLRVRKEIESGELARVKYLFGP
jgi:hypothetical protein